MFYDVNIACYHWDETMPQEREEVAVVISCLIPCDLGDVVVTRVG